jgi:hypothetical protein
VRGALAISSRGMSRSLALLATLLACSARDSAAPPSAVEPTPAVVDAPAPVAAAPPTTEATPAPPRTPGCWEREFGQPPDPSGIGPSLPGPIAGCDGCETLRVGPKAQGLHTEVLRRVRDVVAALPPPPVDEPVLWINSGKRDGEIDASMHNQGLGIDAVICGKDTRATAAALREAGFTCVIEYFDGAGNPCHFAHADLRATKWATGAYAKGGRKARTCPKKAVSRSMSCANGSKRDWTYSEG